MGYPKELDEYTTEVIEEEYWRRLRCKAERKCFYCCKPLNNLQPCKLHPHNGEEQD